MCARADYAKPGTLEKARRLGAKSCSSHAQSMNAGVDDGAIELLLLCPSFGVCGDASERPRFFARKNLPARSSGEIVVRVQLVEIAGPVRLDEVFSGRRREEVDVGGARSAAVLPHFNELEAPR